MSVSRTRNYACVLYPESADPNWRSIISESHVPCFVSPFHDKDCNPDGEIKKAHYHIMVMYDSVKTLEQAQDFFQSFGGVGCEVVNSVRSYARYLCHLDNPEPEKHKYNTHEVVSYGGADYQAIIGTMADKQRHLREMTTWVKENNVFAFSDLWEYAMIHRSDWFDCLCNSGAYCMKEYIKSLKWKVDNNL